MSEEEKDEFKVMDRRRFKADGSVRDCSEEEEERRTEKRAQREKEQEDLASEALNQVDFSSFVVGLATQVLVLLGEIPHPETGKPLPEKQLPAAKQTVEILALLDEKTKGNLGPHEEKLLAEVLTSVSNATAEVKGLDDVQSPGPDVSFSSFLVGLATQVMVMLGEVPHPETGQVVKQIDAAKQTIDVLAVLEDKTKGNLDEAEEKLQAEVLASVRMAFVHAVNA